MKNSLIGVKSNVQINGKNGDGGGKGNDRNSGVELNFRLQAVKEEEELPSSRQINKYRTQLNMKRSIIRNKKVMERQHKEQIKLLTQPSEKGKRSKSVFSYEKVDFINQKSDSNIINS